MRIITLRPVNINDSDFMLLLVNAPGVSRFLPGIISDKSMMKAWIESLDDMDHEYIIEAADTETAIGECSLSIRGKTAEVGMMILPEYWNQGFGSETIRKLLGIAQMLEIETAIATTDKNNRAMISILENNGFSFNKVGWMLKINEDDENDLSDAQTVVEYRKVLK